jgi:HPt (histidine-containing phosphotransfer) domain-containing protein
VISGAMIDKLQFDDTFQYFNPEDVVEVIDLFLQQYPDILKVLAQNIEDHDLIQIKWNAHKLKGTCSQFFDPVSSEDARKLEESAKMKIIEIVDAMLGEFPEVREKLRHELNEGQIYLEVAKVHTLNNFISGLIGSLSHEESSTLDKLEKSKTSDGILQLFSSLENSSAILVDELRSVKDLISST